MVGFRAGIPDSISVRTLFGSILEKKSARFSREWHVSSRHAHPLPHKQIIKKRTLKFPRYQSDEQIKVKSSWRRPRGIDSRHRCRYVLPPPLEPCLRQRCRAGLWQGRPRTRAWLRVA